MNHRTSLVRLSLLFATVGISTATWAGDAKEGMELVNGNCLKCHGNEVYVSPKRKVNSLAGLKKQVQRCELALGMTWFDDQIDDVTAYLNDSFYKFK